MGFKIEAPDYNFKIDGVPYKNQIYRVYLTDKFDFRGTISQHAEQAIKDNKPHAASLPFYYNLFKHLFINREGEFKEEIEIAKKFIMQILLNNTFSTTLTVINYQPKGKKDEIIHDYGLNNQSSILEEIVGPDEFVKDSKNPLVYKALLGTEDTGEINRIYNWLRGEDIQLWRLNKKPTESDMRVVGLDAGPSRLFWVLCIGSPRNSNPALGVVTQKI